MTYIEPGGTEHVVTVPSGTTCRDAAIDNNIPGIDGDCGGACACATCHVFVDPGWIDKVGKVVDGEMEASLLQFVEDFKENSRLACQINLTDELDGLILRIPLGQH